MNLIYFTVGGEPEYVELLKLCIQSIKRYPENKQYKILVICDKSYIRYLGGVELDLIKPTKCILPFGKLDRGWLDIFQFDKILYLDSDIIVSGSLQPIFATIKEPGYLYVGSEIGSHTHRFWSLPFRPYSIEALNLFASNGIQPFNTGIFGFIPSQGIKSMFGLILEDFEENKDKDYGLYEQGFMNYYFNLSSKVNYEIGKFISTFLEPMQIIHHFLGATTNFKVKLERMKQCYQKELK